MTITLEEEERTKKGMWRSSFPEIGVDFSKVGDHVRYVERNFKRSMGSRSVVQSHTTMY